MFLLLDKSLFGLEKDVLYANVYIPPEGSQYYNVLDLNNDGISVLEDAIVENILIDNDVYVILNGDLNSRTSNVAQSISTDYETMFNIHEPEIFIERTSQDNVLNTFGNSLLYMCNTLELCIINGTCKGDKNGAFTYICENGCSVIDYFLLSCPLYVKLFDTCKLEVLERTDGKHLPVRLTLELQDENLEPKSEQTPIRIEKYIWDENKIELFKEAIQSEKFVSEYKDALSCISQDADLALDKFNECIREASTCMKKSITINGQNTQKWFDQECRSKRQEVRKYLRVLRKSIQNREMKRQKRKELNKQKDNHNNVNREADIIIENQPEIDRLTYCVARREYNRLKERKRKEYNHLFIF